MAVGVLVSLVRGPETNRGARLARSMCRSKLFAPTENCCTARRAYPLPGGRPPYSLSFSFRPDFQDGPRPPLPGLAARLGPAGWRSPLPDKQKTPQPFRARGWSNFFLYATATSRARPAGSVARTPAGFRLPRYVPAIWQSENRLCTDCQTDAGVCLNIVARVIMVVLLGFALLGIEQPSPGKVRCQEENFTFFTGVAGSGPDPDPARSRRMWARRGGPSNRGFQHPSFLKKKDEGPFLEVLHGREFDRKPAT